MLVSDRAAHWSKQKERQGTICFGITLLGTRAAVDDKMKNKATSADAIKSLIIASMLWLAVVVIVVDRLACLECLSSLAPPKTSWFVVASITNLLQLFTIQFEIGTKYR